MEMNSANVEAVVKQVLESMLEKKVPEAAPAQSILPGVKFNGGNTLNMARTAGTGSAKPVQPSASVQNYYGIQRPQKPTPTVAPRDIKIPEFLKNTKR